MKTLAIRSRHERGMTLIELMVALTLGLMVVLVVGQVFYSNKTVFRSQAAQAEVQEKGVSPSAGCLSKCARPAMWTPPSWPMAWLSTSLPAGPRSPARERCCRRLAAP
ncbi:prepilin-type N-terminal cleavage/methylation domain-containing protein [Chromobacterium haemolyticum]|nr:prepilin-type N-terminal cleavage/methylation domain-containing protein [Chromobacterium haemolyticum]